MVFSRKEFNSESFHIFQTNKQCRIVPKAGQAEA